MWTRGESFPDGGNRSGSRSRPGMFQKQEGEARMAGAERAGREQWEGSSGREWEAQSYRAM